MRVNKTDPRDMEIAETVAARLVKDYGIPHEPGAQSAAAALGEALGSFIPAEFALYAFTAGVRELSRSEQMPPTVGPPEAAPGEQPHHPHR